jgi:hypothetical protein
MHLVSRVMITAAILALACGQSSQSMSTAETFSSPKGREALARIGACAETAITKISDRSDREEKLDEDGEPVMDPGTYVQYQNGAGKSKGSGGWRSPFQVRRSRASLFGLEAKALPAGRRSGPNLQGDQSEDQRELADAWKLALLRRGIKAGLVLPRRPPYLA